MTEKKTKPHDDDKPAEAPKPFNPPREAGEWVLGPNGPKRKE